MQHIDGCAACTELYPHFTLGGKKYHLYYTSKVVAEALDPGPFPMPIPPDRWIQGKPKKKRKGWRGVYTHKRFSYSSLSYHPSAVWSTDFDDDIDHPPLPEIPPTPTLSVAPMMSVPPPIRQHYIPICMGVCCLMNLHHPGKRLFRLLDR